eukprot:10822084-Karenia_brevis.AAC.1
MQSQDLEKDDLTVERLDAALGSTQDRAGLGTDALEPRTIKDAPICAKMQLVNMMADWEKS